MSTISPHFIYKSYYLYKPEAKAGGLIADTEILYRALNRSLRDKFINGSDSVYKQEVVSSPGYCLTEISQTVHITANFWIIQFK